MLRASNPEPQTGGPPLVFIGGDPGLDLVNTIDWTADGPARERLTSYELLTAWAEGAGVVSAAEAAALRRRAVVRPRQAATALEAARALRAELKRLFHQAASGRPSADASAALERRLASTLPRLGVAPTSAQGSGGGSLRWRWRGADERLDWPLWPVVWSAAKLLTSEESGQVRVCAGPGCGWVYVDRSRNGLRRWCEMRTCGTAAKSERRRRKQA